MKRKTVLMATLLTLCLLSGLAYGEEGEVLKEFTFTDIDGKIFQSSEFEGKPIVIITLASWCPPCKREAPDLEKAYLDYKDRGVVFLGVFSASSEKSIKKFADKYGLTFPVGTAEGLRDIFGWRPFPAAAFVAPDGTVTKKHTGQISYKELAESIEAILEK
jgi:peroxiredoxin